MKFNGLIKVLARNISDKEKFAEYDQTIIPPDVGNTKLDNAKRIIYGKRYLNDPDENVKKMYEEKFDELIAKIKECDGDYELLSARSEGGSRIESSDFLEYMMIKVQGLVILEPYSQRNNATFILVNTTDEDLDDKLQMTRSELTNDALTLKLSHKMSDGYYNPENIIQIINAIKSNKDLFLKQASPDKYYSNLKKVMRKFTVNQIINEYDIKFEDLKTLIDNYLSGKQLSGNSEEIVRKIEDSANNDKMSLQKFINTMSSRGKGTSSKKIGGEDHD